MKHVFFMVGLLCLLPPAMADAPMHGNPPPTGQPQEPATMGLQPYPSVPFATVKGFAFNLAKEGRPECLMPVNPDGSLCTSVEKPGVVLNKKQKRRLLSLLGSPKTFGELEPKCFIPHHAFVFYDHKGKAVGQVSICFLCVGLRADPAVRAQPKSPHRSALSKKGLKKLRALCNDLNLPACNKE